MPPILKLIPKDSTPAPEEKEKQQAILSFLKELITLNETGKLDMISVVYQEVGYVTPHLYTFADRGFIALSGAALTANALEPKK